MPHTDNRAQQDQVFRHLRAMGIEVRRMGGGRCVLASMDLSERPFEFLGGSLRIRRVAFASVGADRIKCLRPRPLFQLPILSIRNCRNDAAIEAEIRNAWNVHVAKLRSARQWLQGLGTETTAETGEALLSFPIEGESPGTRGRVVEPRRVILPGRGPLSGRTVLTPEDRVHEVGYEARSAIDLEIEVSNRLELLARDASQRVDERRIDSLVSRAGPDGSNGPSGSNGLNGLGGDARSESRARRILLVGPQISDQRSYAESLRLRGYEVIPVRTPNEAVEAFEEISPELVIADMDLGRTVGTELIVTLREVTGVENVPVVLVDQSMRATRRDAARKVGAAGYLTYPIDMKRIAKQLVQIIDAPARRRFTRYKGRVAVRMAGRPHPFLATALGRGGMFLCTEQEVAPNSFQHCEVSLPEIGERVRVDAEVLYRRGHAGPDTRGFGVRFASFPDAREGILIDYLRTLDTSLP